MLEASKVPRNRPLAGRDRGLHAAECSRADDPAEHVGVKAELCGIISGRLRSRGNIRAIRIGRAAAYGWRCSGK